MICIIALVVFGILGIFSVTHRKIAFEAFNCVFRKTTFRKCNSDLDKRLKSQIVAKVMNKSPKTARFVYRYFEILSWIFTIAMIVSLVYTVIGGYNYYQYGNCNGPNQEGFCIFDPLGENVKYSNVQEATCSTDEKTEKTLTLSNVDINLFPQVNRGAENQVLFIGCYACPYTRSAYPDIQRLSNEQNVNFVFAHLPVKDGTLFISNIVNCVAKIDEQKIVPLNNLLFEMDTNSLNEKDNLFDAVERLGLNKTEIETCAMLNKTSELSQKQFDEIKKTGVYGTPTVFINGEAVVGPKPFRVYKRELI
jgi:hypothetical protein